MMVRAAVGALAAAAVVGVLAGPAAAGSAGQPAAPQAAGPVQPQAVATVIGAGVTVTFLSTAGPDGQPRIAMYERGSARAARSPVAGLLAQWLTSMEIYLALAPAGTPAPEALAQVQATEAAQLGRDASIHHPATAPVAAHPNSLQGCKNLIFVDLTSSNGFGIWGNIGAVAYPAGLVGTQSQFVGGVSSYETTDVVGFGACNESGSATVSASYGYNQRWNNLGFQNSSTFLISPGGYGVFYYAYAWSANGITHGASYRIDGASAGPFDLVTGEWFPFFP